MTSSIRKVTRFLAVGILAAILLVGRAEAASISLLPNSQNVALGSNFSVDVMVDGLVGQSVGGASFLLSFDSSLLKGLSFTLDPNAKMGFAIHPQENDPVLNPLGNDYGSGFGVGGASPFEGFFTADISLNDAALQALQGTGFRLATLNFTAIGSGFSPLTLAVEPLQGVFLSDGGGLELPTQGISGSVCVGGAAGGPNDACTVAAVPEPGTIALLGTGLAALVRRRRKAQTAV
jgi:hypothetical protein